MRRHVLILAAPLLLLGACATGPADNAASGENLASAGLTPYGKFMAGEGALRDGRSDEAARMFDEARVLSGDEPAISERAFMAALLSGDITQAAAVAPTGDDVAISAKRLGHLVVAVENLAQGKAKLARQQLTDEDIGFPHRPAAAMLAPWVSAEAGDIDGSVVRPASGGDRLIAYFGLIGQAYLYERTGRFDEAETNFKTVASGQSAGEMVVLGYGGFLERRGRKADAVTLYMEALAREPASPQLQAALARAKSGKAPPPPPTLREGAGMALISPAAIMVSQRQNQIALAYLRLALRLNPELDEAWLLVGDLMQGAGDADAARAAYGKVKPRSPDYSAAQAKLAWSYQGEDDPKTAIRVARTAAATGSSAARLTLADLLRSNEQYAESADILTGLIKESKTADWRLFYARGIARERLDRWSEAEPDFIEALKLRPDEPELLNYLGYTWINRGERLGEAMAMVEKAVAANPRSGAMVDSLGWAHYRLGDYKAAVKTLEQAVELTAGDPEINDHLGDAYWKVGRQDEALFQWRRVLTLQPDEKIKVAVEAKIAAATDPTKSAANVLGR